MVSNAVRDLIGLLCACFVLHILYTTTTKI